LGNFFVFSSLASVAPPNVWYRLQLPQEVIDSGQLSALQLEAVVYASQKHETFLPNGNRAGFLIGNPHFIDSFDLFTDLLIDSLSHLLTHSITH